MVINLETLQEVTLHEEPNSLGYYDLNMRFERMKGGLISKNLEKQRKTLEDILQAKQNFDAIITSAII